VRIAAETRPVGLRKEVGELAAGAMLDTHGELMKAAADRMLHDVSKGARFVLERIPDGPGFLYGLTQLATSDEPLKTAAGLGGGFVGGTAGGALGAAAGGINAPVGARERCPRARRERRLRPLLPRSSRPDGRREPLDRRAAKAAVRPLIVELRTTPRPRAR
jgi:hypothetical protein